MVYFWELEQQGWNDSSRLTSSDSKQAGGNTDDGDIDGTERRTKLARLGTPSLPLNYKHSRLTQPP